MFYLFIFDNSSIDFQQKEITSITKTNILNKMYVSICFYLSIYYFNLFNIWENMKRQISNGA